MHIKIENRAYWIGYLEYLLQTITIIDHEDALAVMKDLNAILNNNSLQSSGPKLKQIESHIGALLGLCTNEESLSFLELHVLTQIYSKLIELECLSEQEIVSLSTQRLHQDRQVIILADELYENLLIRRPELNRSSNLFSWVFERTEHFYLGMQNNSSIEFLDSAFQVSCPGYEEWGLEDSLAEIAQPYLNFFHKNFIEIHVLMNLSTELRQRILHHADDLIQLFKVSPNPVNYLFHLDKNTYENLFRQLPQLLIINEIFRCPIEMLLTLSPATLQKIIVDMDIYKMLLKSKFVLGEMLLQLGPDELERLKKHHFFAIQFLTFRDSWPVLIKFSDNQLTQIAKHQHAFLKLCETYASDLQDLLDIDASQYQHFNFYYDVSKLERLKLRELFQLPIETAGSISKLSLFIEELQYSTSIQIQDFFALSAQQFTVLNQHQNFIRELLNYQIKFTDIIPSLSTQNLRIIEINYKKCFEWANKAPHKWLKLISASEKALQLFISKDGESMIKIYGIGEFDILELSDEEIEQFNNNASTYLYLFKAKSRSNFRALLYLPKNVQDELHRHAYTYYRMLNAGFEVEDLDPLYRLFYYEVMEFNQIVQDIAFIKNIDKAKFKLIMTKSSIYLEFIREGLIPIDELVHLHVDILTHINDNSARYITILKDSHLSLMEFLEIEPDFRSKLIQYLPSLGDILIHLKDYIRLEPEERAEIIKNRHVYRLLLSQSQLNLTFMMNLTNEIRQVMLSNPEPFIKSMEYLKHDFWDFCLDHQHDLLAWVTKISSVYPMMRRFGFDLHDMIQIPMESYHEFHREPEWFSLFAQRIFIKIQDIFKWPVQDIVNIKMHGNDIEQFLYFSDWSFQDLMELNHRCSGKLLGNLGHLKSAMADGRVEKETLMALDEAELEEMLSVNFIHSKRLRTGSFF